MIVSEPPLQTSSCKRSQNQQKWTKYETTESKKPMQKKKNNNKWFTSNELKTVMYQKSIHFVKVC